MIIKYLEWNLNARGGKGYEIPDFVTRHIEEVDIFSLVDFFSSGWDQFKNELEKDYDLYCSPFISCGYNQVCIGFFPRQR